MCMSFSLWPSVSMWEGTAITLLMYLIPGWPITSYKDDATFLGNTELEIGEMQVLSLTEWDPAERQQS